MLSLGPVNIAKSDIQQTVSSLLGFIAKRSEAAPVEDLLLADPEAEALHLSVSFRSSPYAVSKDVQIPLPHPIYAAERTCIFTPDPQDDYAASLAECGLGRIISLETAKTQLAEHSAKRNLLNLYPFFLADSSVVTYLPKIVGAKAFRRHKHPVVLRKATPQRVKDALRSTYARFGPKRTTVDVVVGRTSQQPAEVTANVVAALQTMLAGTTTDDVGADARVDLVTSVRLVPSHAPKGVGLPSVPLWLAATATAKKGRGRSVSPGKGKAGSKAAVAAKGPEKRDRASSVASARSAASETRGSRANTPSRGRSVSPAKAKAGAGAAASTPSKGAKAQGGAAAKHAAAKPAAAKPAAKPVAKGSAAGATGPKKGPAGKPAAAAAKPPAAKPSGAKATAPPAAKKAPAAKSPAPKGAKAPPSKRK